MEKIADNEAAFASVGYGLSGDGYCQVGLTKREYFAAMAMQGLIANPDESKREYWESKVPELANCKNLAEFLCKSSVMMADALIKELNKETL